MIFLVAGLVSKDAPACKTPPISILIADLIRLAPSCMMGKVSWMPADKPSRNEGIRSGVRGATAVMDFADSRALENTTGSECDGVLSGEPEPMYSTC